MARKDKVTYPEGPEVYEGQSLVLTLSSRLNPQTFLEHLDEFGEIGGEFFKGDEIKLKGKLKFKVKSTEPKEGIDLSEETLIEIPLTRRKCKSTIILAIDTSYSMKKKDYEPNRFEAILKGVSSFLDEKIRTESKDEIGVIGFGYDYELITEPVIVTKDEKKRIIKELKSLKLTGRASIASGLIGASEMFHINESKNLKVLNIITDGIDPIGVEPLEEGTKCADEAIVINTILIGDEPSDVDTLSKISGIGHGKFYCLDANNLQDEFKDLAKNIIITKRIGNSGLGMKEREVESKDDSAVILVNAPSPERKKVHKKPIKKAVSLKEMITGIIDKIREKSW